MPECKYKVAIIGAGPAGISCALQLKRYGVDFILFERDKPGGLLRNAHCVENYPGFPEGITGEKLVALFLKQLKASNINIVKENVKSVDYKDNFLVRTDNRIYISEILVIASGTKPKKLIIEIPYSAESRIFYEIVDLKKLHEKTIGIAGSGDAGFDYALNLSKKNKVFLLNRTQHHKCLPLLFERCIKNKNIKYITEFEISKIDTKNKQLVLYSKNNEHLLVDYLIVAIGREPNIDFLTKKIKRRFKALEKSKKLYMIGDVKNGLFRQTAIAVGDGIKAAMEISKILTEKNRKGSHQT